MTEFAYLGIDQGSSSSKAVLLNSMGECIWSDRRVVSTSEHSPTHITQDPYELLSSVCDLLKEALSFCAQQSTALKSIGLSVQRSGVCAWDEQTGEVLHPMISWRDRRTKPLLEQVDPQLVQQRSSIPLSPHYAGGKYALLQQEFPDALVGTLETYLLWNLCDEAPFITEDTMAHRTMLYDLNKGTWSQELCKAFGVNRSRLPSLTASIGPFGSISVGDTTIPITACLGDQQSALFSLVSLGERRLINMGTIGSLLALSGESPKILPGYISSVAYSSGTSRDRVFVIEGTVNSCGKTIDLLSEILQCSPADLDKLAQSATGKHVCFAPLGKVTTPHWRDDLGNFFSATAPEKKEELAASLLKNLGEFFLEDLIAFRDADLLDRNSAVAVSGGVSRSDFLLQYIANVSGLTLKRMELGEAGANGAALAAAKGVGKSLRKCSPGKTTDFLPERDFLPSYHEAWCTLRDKVLSGDVTELHPMALADLKA